MLITNRQPARSTPDPGPLPGNIITSWQKNSEVIHYQILKYVLQFNWQHTALHQSQLEGISSGGTNTSREVIHSFWAWGETFSHNHFHYFVVSWEEPRMSQEPTTKKMKNTENIVFAVKTQADSNVSLWGTRQFCQVIRQRGTRDAPPEGCKSCEKKTTKTIAGMFCDLQWLLVDMRRPPSPLPALCRGHTRWDAPFPKIHTRLVSFTFYCNRNMETNISHLKRSVQNI